MMPDSDQARRQAVAMKLAEMATRIYPMRDAFVDAARALAAFYPSLEDFRRASSTSPDTTNEQRPPTQAGAGSGGVIAVQDVGPRSQAKIIPKVIQA
jgi:hypothetical protein